MTERDALNRFGRLPRMSTWRLDLRTAHVRIGKSTTRRPSSVSPTHLVARYENGTTRSVRSRARTSVRRSCGIRSADESATVAPPGREFGRSQRSDRPRLPAGPAASAAAANLCRLGRFEPERLQPVGSRIDLATIDGHSSRYFNRSCRSRSYGPRGGSVNSTMAGGWCSPDPHVCRSWIEPPCDHRGEPTNLCERIAFGHLEPGCRPGLRSTGGGWSIAFVAHESQLIDVPDDLTNEERC